MLSISGKFNPIHQARSEISAAYRDASVVATNSLSTAQEGVFVIRVASRTAGSFEKDMLDGQASAVRHFMRKNKIDSVVVAAACPALDQLAEDVVNLATTKKSPALLKPPYDYEKTLAEIAKDPSIVFNLRSEIITRTILHAPRGDQRSVVLLPADWELPAAIQTSHRVYEIRNPQIASAASITDTGKLPKFVETNDLPRLFDNLTFDRIKDLFPKFIFDPNKHSLAKAKSLLLHYVSEKANTAEENLSSREQLNLIREFRTLWEDVKELTNYKMLPRRMPKN